MASVQACGSAEAYSQQHHSFLHQLLDKAHCLIPLHCHHETVKHQAAVGGHLHNNTVSAMKFHDKHDWSGRNKTPYPPTIARGHAGTFVHFADCGGRADMAAVVYAGSTDPCCPSNLNVAYLVAWSVREHCGFPKPNKVYVEAGAFEKYCEINWCEIKAKLEASCNTSYYVDECTGTEVFAKINDGNNAALVANFNNLPC